MGKCKSIIARYKVCKIKSKKEERKEEKVGECRVSYQTNIHSPYLFPNCKLSYILNAPTTNRRAFRHKTSGKMLWAMEVLPTWTFCLLEKKNIEEKKLQILSALFLQPSLTGYAFKHENLIFFRGNFSTIDLLPSSHTFFFF